MEAQLTLLTSFLDDAASMRPASVTLEDIDIDSTTT